MSNIPAGGGVWCDRVRVRVNPDQHRDADHV
jgi:hypothetical protein